MSANELWFAFRIPERCLTRSGIFLYLEFVPGLPSKPNNDHELGEEVLLDTIPPAPSSDPMATVLPPTVSGEPVVRRMYVKKRDLDPDEPGGIGYTIGCPGCKAIIKGTTYAIGQSEDCRRRVKEKISQADPETRGSMLRRLGRTNT